MEELREDLLGEETKNQYLSSEVQRLNTNNSELTAECEEAYRQLEEVRQNETNYIERIGTLRVEKEKLCGQLVQEIERQRLG